MSFPGLDSAVQRGFRDLEGPAYLRNRVSFLIEVKGNAELFLGKGFRSTAFLSSGAGCNKSCLGSFPNEVSLKFR